MELSYWQSRWQKNYTGWHMDTVYPKLPELWPSLGLEEGSKVFVPLCGKSLDMGWLAKQGHYVVGVDAVEKALAEFTHSYPETFSKDSRHGFHVYQSKHIELWQGDFLKLPREELPQIDAIYDKAAMIALPERMRASYAKKILAFCQDNTQMMLQTFEYDQSEMSGPPFSVLQREVELHFSEHFEITLLHEQSKFDELDKFQQRGLSTYLNEKIYHLKPLK